MTEDQPKRKGGRIRSGVPSNALKKKFADLHDKYVKLIIATRNSPTKSNMAIQFLEDLEDLEKVCKDRHYY